MDFARAMAPRLGLAPTLLNGPVVRLSTGERQRMALIRALALALAGAAARRTDRSRWMSESTQSRRGPCCANASPTGVMIAMVTHSAAQAARLGHRHLRMENRHLVPA